MGEIFTKKKMVNLKKLEKKINQFDFFNFAGTNEKNLFFWSTDDFASVRPTQTSRSFHGSF